MLMFSLIVATRGRDAVLGTALASFSRQSLADFEVIIVDQNAAGLLDKIIADWSDRLRIKHLHMPDLSGLSRARNAGLAHATGTYVCFPDDDCTYPPNLLADAVQRFEAEGMDILTGRAADETGRTINGRFLSKSAWINRSNALVTQIEWMAFYRRSVLITLGGFDEDVGVGAKTPWQSSEGPELMFRALQKGFKAFYTPAIFGHHPELKIFSPDDAMLRKAHGYARGMGYVMAKHHLPFPIIVNYLIRPAGAAVLFLLRGKIRRSRYYWTTLTGRLLGCADAIHARRRNHPVV